MSMHADLENAYSQYRTTAATTARPPKLLLMLYDGLVLALKQAQRALEQQDLSNTHGFLMKGQNIITELMSTLKMEYEISLNLYRLYDYLRQRLITANTKKDPAIIEEVLGMVKELRAAWAAAAEQAPTRE